MAFDAADCLYLCIAHGLHLVPGSHGPSTALAVEIDRRILFGDQTGYVFHILDWEVVGGRNMTAPVFLDRTHIHQHGAFGLPVFLNTGVYVSFTEIIKWT